MASSRRSSVVINVKFLDADQNVIAESGAYDFTTGELSHDGDAKIYEVEPGLDEVTAPLVGTDPGPSFHFVLNNKIFKDNRIPPQGFTNAAFADFGGAPVGGRTSQPGTSIHSSSTQSTGPGR